MAKSWEREDHVQIFTSKHNMNVDLDVINVNIRHPRSPKIPLPTDSVFQEKAEEQMKKIVSKMENDNRVK